jgi:ribA/ribD-fused uncharacterized protein
MKEIKFYKVNGPYGFFSNFSPHLIFIEGEIWPTVEHYFQASKFENADVRNKIKSLKSPMDASIKGRDRNVMIRPDWEMIKEEVMLNGLLAKFFQHPNLKTELLKTENSVLIEDTPNDRYWGNGGDGSGKNRLGKLLMEVRDKINLLSSNSEEVLPPWIAFPETDQFDLFWRMGLGEEYLSQWSKYYLNCENERCTKKSSHQSVLGRTFMINN